jgi:hypothetical protein
VAGAAMRTQCADIGQLLGQRRLYRGSGRPQARRQHVLQIAGNGLQTQHALERTAPALGNVHLQHPIRPQSHPHAQRCRRGLLQRTFRTAQEHRRIAGLCVDLQTADLLGPRLREPGEYGTHGPCLEDLFGGPEPLQRRNGPHPHQLRRRYAQLRQPPGVRRLGWRHQVNAATLLQQGRQRGPQQAPFAPQCLRQQQLRHGLRGPPATGQLRIQCAKPGRNSARHRSHHVHPAPDSRSYGAGKGSGVKGMDSSKGGKGHGQASAKITV